MWIRLANLSIFLTLALTHAWTTGKEPTININGVSLNEVNMENVILVDVECGAQVSDVVRKGSSVTRSAGLMLRAKIGFLIGENLNDGLFDVHTS